MRALKSFVASALLFSAAAACSSSTPASPTSDTSQTEPSAVLGEKLVAENNCKSCHGADLSGSATGIPGHPARNAPNLTPHGATGVGDWSDAQLATAIRTGIDDEDKPLCAIMPKFSTFSDADVANVIAYLRSLPPVSKEIPDSECPGD